MEEENELKYVNCYQAKIVYAKQNRITVSIFLVSPWKRKKKSSADRGEVVDVSIITFVSKYVLTNIVCLNSTLILRQI